MIRLRNGYDYSKKSLQKKYLWQQNSGKTEDIIVYCE